MELTLNATQTLSAVVNSTLLPHTLNATQTLSAVVNSTLLPHTLNATQTLSAVVNSTLLPHTLNATQALSVVNSTLLPDLTRRSPVPMPPQVVHARRLRAVYPWVLVGVGLPANTACIITIFSMTVSPYYVALLAVADTLALVFKLLYHQLITHRAVTDASCHFFYSTSFLSCYANWVLALIGLERFVAVCFPFKKQQLFSKRRIVFSILGLTAALGVVFIPTLFFFGKADKSGKTCVLRESMKPFKKRVWSNGLLTSLYFFLPFLLVAIFTALIIKRLQVLRRKRQMSQSSGRSGSGPEHAVSIMLVSASLIFVVLMLPACLYHLFLKDLYDVRVLEERAESFLLYQVVTFLSDITHAVNFFVYFLSAGNFRAAFGDLLRRCCPGIAKRTRKLKSTSDGSKSVPLTATTDNHHVKDTEIADTVM